MLEQCCSVSEHHSLCTKWGGRCFIDKTNTVGKKASMWDAAVLESMN